MRKITINFADCPYSLFAGYIGEHNATEIQVQKPAELSGATYSLAFMTNSEVIHSKNFSSNEEICVALWQQLTQSDALYVQLESRDENGNYLGKSAVAKLIFLKSVNGKNVIGDTDNHDVYSEITQNSAFRKSLEDNTDTLGKLSESDTGRLLFNGKPIGGGSGTGGFSPIVEVEAIEGGHRVTITDAEGTESFDVPNGYTPVKGVDYFTEADKTEIANAVLDALETAEGGLY